MITSPTCAPKYACDAQLANNDLLGCALLLASKIAIRLQRSVVHRDNASGKLVWSPHLSPRFRFFDNLIDAFSTAKFSAFEAFHAHFASFQLRRWLFDRDPSS